MEVRRDEFCVIGVDPPHLVGNRRAGNNNGRLLSDILNCDEGARQPAGNASSATPGTAEEDGGHHQDKYREQQCASAGQKQRQARVLAAATLDVASALVKGGGGRISMQLRRPPLEREQRRRQHRHPEQGGSGIGTRKRSLERGGQRGRSRRLNRHREAQANARRLDAQSDRFHRHARRRGEACP